LLFSCIGPNSECRPVGPNAICSCLPGFIGNPPYCRPECTTHAECPSVQACIQNHCADPCPGACGLCEFLFKHVHHLYSTCREHIFLTIINVLCTDAICHVINHNPVCVCPDGYEGDPFRQCNPAPKREIIPQDPCSPSPCGTNAVCTRQGNTASCKCLPEYFGDPYVACKPECVLNSDCPYDKACSNNKCIDPCPGTCGASKSCVPFHSVQYI